MGTQALSSRTYSAKLHSFDLYGRRHGAAIPIPASASAPASATASHTASDSYQCTDAAHGQQRKYMPEVYDRESFMREEQERRRRRMQQQSDSQAQPPSAQTTSSSSSPANFTPSATPRSVFLDDVSRVLLGVGLVLEHGSVFLSSSSSHTLSTLYDQNAQSMPEMSEVKRMWSERMRGTTAHKEQKAYEQEQQQQQPQQEQQEAATTTSSQQRALDSSASPLPPFPDAASVMSSLPFPRPPTSLPDLPSFVSQSAQQAAQVAQRVAGVAQQVTQQFTNIIQPQQQTSAAAQAQPSTATSDEASTPMTMPSSSPSVARSPAPASTPSPSVSAPLTPALDTSKQPPTLPTQGEQQQSNLNDKTSSSPSHPPSSRYSDADSASHVHQQSTMAPTRPTTANRIINDAARTVGQGVKQAQNVTARAADTVVSNAVGAASAAANAATAAMNSASVPFQTESRFKPRERTVPSSPLARIAGFSQIASSIIFGTIKDRVTGAFSGGERQVAPAANGQPVDTRTTEDTQEERKDDGTAATPSTNTKSQSDFERTSSSFMDSSSSIPAPPRPRSASPVNPFLSEANTQRLAEGLCRMRGAALKVGQMLSIQDESLVPAQLQAVLDRVRDGADVMPRAQLERALLTELGPNWMDALAEFDWQPIAAASIGQVHRARLKKDGMEVVMKVQYPGVAESINSDVNNLKRLIRFVNVLPRGMYIDETMKAAKEELALECDYTNEALAQKKFKKLVAGDKAFYVPTVIDELSTKRILTSERIYGVPIDRLAPQTSGTNGNADASTHPHIEVSTAERNTISHSLIRLCLNELFNYRFMQTDPNWSNFLYHPQNHLLYLIDFGASRLYRKQFVDEYLRMVYACATKDRQGIIESSIKLGFLTGDESKEMMEAHAQSGYIIGEPFGSDEPYDFVAGNIPARVSAHAATMLRLRLTPPPKEAYTLHRKLSGAFLTCRKLHAKIQVKDTFMNVYKNYQFGPELPLIYGAASKEPIETHF